MHGEDWVLNLLGSPLASSPVSKSFPNRSVGKKPSHRPLTVNTIILHIQMRITRSWICSSLWSVLTHLTPDWLILYHFQRTKPPISITTSLFTSLYRLKVFLISNVSILIYVGGIFWGFTPVTPESGSKDVKMSPSRIQTLGTKGPGAQGDPYCS